MLVVLSLDLFHRPPFRQLVDKLVEVAHLPHDLVFDLLDPYAADHARDEFACRIKLWRFLEERLEADLLLYLHL